MPSYIQTQTNADGMQRSLELDDLLHLNPLPLEQLQVQFQELNADQVDVELNSHDRMMQIFHHKLLHLLQCVPCVQLRVHKQFSFLR